MTMPIYFINGVVMNKPKSKGQQFLRDKLMEYRHKTIDGNRDLLRFEATLDNLATLASDMSPHSKPIFLFRSTTGSHSRRFDFYAGQTIASVYVEKITYNWKGGTL